ncbi:MAG TPA: glycerophosphodiester phosphodiesterase [Gemmatimonadaceae bacterium]|nr:glycerophosphodiester phosphodiesterase [Gemmatimonadaceae bacterium]
MPRRARENTLPSFAAALDAGADGIELDVHATADHVVVVHHDPHLPGGRPIASMAWDELRRTAEGAHVDVPTLAAVCELVGARAELFVEIKGAGIEEDVLGVLARHHGRSAIHSFDHSTIARIARRDGSLRLGLLFERRVGEVAALMTMHGARDAWPHHSLVDEPFVAAVHGLDGRVIAWTANAPGEIARLIALGVDGICTDDVTLIAPS